MVRTALEQELGLAAYFVSSEGPLEKGPRNEGLESDAEKPSSTDNEDEEPVTEGRPPLLISGAACPCLDSCPPSAWPWGQCAGRQLWVRAIQIRLWRK